MPDVIMVGREDWMTEAVESCARGKVSFSVLCEAFAKAGYNTAGLFEMVAATERALTTEEQS